MPARIDKKAVVEILQSIRNDLARHHLIVKSQPPTPERATERQKLLENLKPAVEKKLDGLYRILNINTKISEE